MVAQVNDTAPDAQDAADSDLEGGTPQEQPTAQAPVATARTPIPVDVPRLQREYTQANQRWAEVTRSLGLPKDTPTDVVAARLAELQTPRGEDDGPLDPEAIKRLRSLENREWAAEQSMYGDTALFARTFYEKVRSHPNMSPSDVATEFYAAVDAAVDARMAGAPPQGEEAAPERPQAGFRQEAPLQPPAQGGLDAKELDGLSTRDRENRITDWIKSRLPG